MPHTAQGSGEMRSFVLAVSISFSSVREQNCECGCGLMGGLIPITPIEWGAPHTPQTPADSRLWGQDSPELFGVSVSDPLTGESSPQDVLEEINGNSYFLINISN